MRIVGQIVGGCAAIVAIYSFQQRERRGILFFQTISCILFTLHFLLIGNAYTGMAFNIIGLFRCLVFSQRGRSAIASHPAWLFLFSALIVGTVAVTWDGPLTLFPMGAMLFTTFSMWVTKARHVRLLSLPSSPLWLVYNLAKGSIAGIVTESFVMLSIGIATVRFDLLGQKETGQRA